MALESLRLEQGYIGRDWLATQKAAGPLPKRLVTLKLDDRELLLAGSEPLFADGAPAGCGRAGAFGLSIGDGAGLFAMRGLLPQREATLLQPGIQRGKIWKVRHPMQHLVARIPNVLLDLPLLPPGGWIAELGLIDIVVRHREEAHVDLPLLSAANAIHRRLHVIVDAPTRDAAKDPECMPVPVKQHLMGL
jgi:hypothetical protein